MPVLLEPAGLVAFLEARALPEEGGGAEEAGPPPLSPDAAALEGRAGWRPGPSSPIHRLQDSWEFVTPGTGLLWRRGESPGTHAEPFFFLSHFRAYPTLGCRAGSPGEQPLSALPLQLRKSQGGLSLGGSQPCPRHFPPPERWEGTTTGPQEAGGGGQSFGTGMGTRGDGDLGMPPQGCKAGQNPEIRDARQSAGGPEVLALLLAGLLPP